MQTSALTSSVPPGVCLRVSDWLTQLELHCVAATVQLFFFLFFFFFFWADLVEMDEEAALSQSAAFNFGKKQNEAWIWLKSPSCGRNRRAAVPSRSHSLHGSTLCASGLIYGNRKPCAPRWEERNRKRRRTAVWFLCPKQREEGWGAEGGGRGGTSKKSLRVALLSHFSFSSPPSLPLHSVFSPPVPCCDSGSPWVR